MIRFFLFFAGLFVSAIQLAFLIETNFFYIVPFLGCLIGIWYAVELFSFCATNFEPGELENIMKNMTYILKHSTGHAVQFLDKVSVPHEEFKKRF